MAEPSASDAARRIAYTFAREGGDVHVEAEWRGDASGTTELKLETWGGILDPEANVQDLLVLDRGGLPLPVDRATPQAWTVRHRPGQMMSIRYRLVASPPPGPGPSSYYRPVVREEVFHAVGETALLFPEHLDDEEPCAIRLRWRGFAEAGWTVASSHGVGQPQLDLSLSLERFRHGVFYAGPLRRTARPFRGGTIELVAGGSFDISDGALAVLAERVIAAGCEFFAEEAPSPFVITVLPLAGARNAKALGGTSLTRSFALFLAERGEWASEGGGSSSRSCSPTRCSTSGTAEWS